DQVQITADGTLSNVRMPGIVKGMDLTGGPLSLNVTKDTVQIAGKAKLDGRPVTLRWQQYIDTAKAPYDSQVTAELVADEALRTRLGVDLDGWLSGAVPVNVTYTEFPGRRAEAAIQMDITPATLSLKPFDATKPPGVSGQATALLHLENGEARDIKELTVQSADMRIEDGTITFRKDSASGTSGQTTIERGNISRAVFGENDFSLMFETTPAGAFKIAIDGAFMDARPFLGKDKKGKDKKAKSTDAYEGPAMVVSVSVARMRTHTARIVEGAKIYLDRDKTGAIQQLEMDAVAGAGAVYFRFKPDETGALALRFEADDAGAALRAFDLYNNMAGGRLVVAGRAENPATPKTLKGTVALTDFHVTNAPVLARILGGLGPTGLSQLLGGEGLYFARLESGFEWIIRPQGDIHLIRDGRTSGSSLGLTFDGKIDKEAGTTDIEGTIVPMSGVNEIIGNIPLIGDILAGGRGGAIFAATYAIKGPSAEPTVTVNPLAVLAPGILRRILFESDPTP
ncbi:MAG: heme utilization protein, partial [Alphaproteobacteria bacterium]|nr:heme utilization protein [Alphaproteobacteria bacterium]